MNLREMTEPTYEQWTPSTVVCSVCVSIVPVGSTETHTAHHREIVEWLQSLRDGKADVGII